jgi:hypothetical protein
MWRCQGTLESSALLGLGTARIARTQQGAPRPPLCISLRRAFLLRNLARPQEPARRAYAAIGAWGWGRRPTKKERRELRSGQAYKRSGEWDYQSLSLRRSAFR